MSSIAISFNAAILGVLLLCLLFHDAAAEWVETAKLTDSDGGGIEDQFGQAVAIDNGTLVVGAHADDVNGARPAGSATIFELLSVGAWVAAQKLTLSDAEAYDYFGFSVAISSGVVAVGAYGEDDGGSRSGAVYIYGKGKDGLWTERQKLVPSDVAAFDYFSERLAMHENAFVVGARGDDSDSGSVYVYTLLANTWTQVAKLTARDRSAGDEFGYSVAIDADTIIVGAQWDDDLGAGSGSAYVFQREGEASSWTQVAKLTPSDGQSLDHFGRTVALEGGTVWVSSFNNVDRENVGAVYQFGEGGGGTWTQQNKLVARDVATGDAFGHGLAFQSGTLVAGAWGQESNTGAVYVFQEVSGVWTQRAKLVASDGATLDRFGYAVGVDDGMVIAGADFENSYQGSVYVFENRASETSARPSVVPMPTMQPSQYPSVRHAAKLSITPSVATSVMPTGPTTRNPSELPAAPVSTQSFGLQPIVIVVFVGIAFLAGGVAVWIYSRRNNRPAIPDQHTPQNDHRVVITDNVSELEEPSVAIGIRSVEASAVSKVHTLDAGTPTIDDSQ